MRRANAGQLETALEQVPVELSFRRLLEWEMIGCIDAFQPLSEAVPCRGLQQFWQQLAQMQDIAWKDSVVQTGQAFIEKVFADDNLKKP